MSKKKQKKVAPKVYLASRVKQDVKDEITRLAERAGEKPSEYIATVLEAHCDGKAWCPRCDEAHHFHQQDHNQSL